MHLPGLACTVGPAAAAHSWGAIDAWSATFGAIVAALSTAAATHLIEVLRDRRRARLLVETAAKDVREILHASVRMVAEDIVPTTVRIEAESNGAPIVPKLVGEFAHDAIYRLTEAADVFGKSCPWELRVFNAHFKALVHIVNELNRTSAEWDDAYHHGGGPWASRCRKQTLSGLRVVHEQAGKLHLVGVKALHAMGDVGEVLEMPAFKRS